MDAAQEVRRAAITAELRKRGADEVTGTARRELVHELTALLSPPAKPAAIDDRVAGLALRADTLSRALDAHEWSGSDRRLIADALADTLSALPQGVFLPPTRAVSGRPPVAVLPAQVTQPLSDPLVTGDARESSRTDLENTLSGMLGPAPGADAGGEGA